MYQMASLQYWGTFGIGNKSIPPASTNAELPKLLQRLTP